MPSLCRYWELARRFPEVPRYQLYWAQSLCKAGMFADASRAAAAVEGFPQASPSGCREGRGTWAPSLPLLATPCLPARVSTWHLAPRHRRAPRCVQEVSQLQAAIKYEAGDLRGCRAALEAALASGDPSAAANAGCLLYKEGQYAAAAAQFGAASAAGGHTPELAYAVAACQYRQHDFPAALASLADIVEAGVQQHPELGIGTQTEGMEVGVGWPLCCPVQQRRRATRWRPVPGRAAPYLGRAPAPAPAPALPCPPRRRAAWATAPS